MQLLLNVIWLVFAGLWMALGYALAGVIMFALIITIPFGVQAFKLASFTLWPFGRTMVKRADAGEVSAVGNVIWLVLAGWWLALGHLVTAAAQVVTIIGIPLAIANVKLIPGSLWPFGREIVKTSELTPALRAGGDIVAFPQQR